MRADGATVTSASCDVFARMSGSARERGRPLISNTRRHPFEVEGRHSQPVECLGLDRRSHHLC